MKNTIDCLIIGHNQIAYESFISIVEFVGKDSPTFKDLNMNYLTHKSKKYNATEIYNEFCRGSNPVLNFNETFSTTIAYLVTYLSKRGFSFDFINSFQSEKERFKDLLLNSEIKLIAITTTLYVVLTPIIEIIEFIKKHNKDIKIVIGGPFIATQIRTSSRYDVEYLFDFLGVDYYVNSSQGEKALEELLGMLKDGEGDLNKIDNLIYKSNGKYFYTNSVEESNKLSENMINWDLVSDRVNKFVNLRTSISCPFNCSFCGFPEHAGKYQTVNISDFEHELESVQKLDKLENVFFIDDTFNIPPSRFKEILHLLIKKQIKFKWHSYIRSQYVDEEIALLMKEAGCESVFLGIESGNDFILKNMNKNVTVREYERGIKNLIDAGIQTLGSFIVGFPGETEDTFNDTFNFIKNCGIDYYRAQLWYYEHITPIWRQKEKYNLKGQGFEWSHSTMDSKQACDLLEKIAIEIQTPVRVPQYYFNMEFVVQLLHKGMSKEKIKCFLKAFNEGVKEKLINKNNAEISSKVFEMFSEVNAKCSL